MFATSTVGTIMPRQIIRTPVELWPIERGRIVGLREAEWTYWRITARVGHNITMLCHCFQQ